jgi:hypothetical protein
MSKPPKRTKNKAPAILRRWISLDHALHNRSLNIRFFAKRTHVTEKTIRRDIKAFKWLGKKYGRDVYFYREGAEYVWGYAYGTGRPLPLFTENIRWQKPEKPKSAGGAGHG